MESRPELLHPWQGEPIDYRCVAIRFSREPGPADYGIVLPDRIARAAPRRRAEWLAGRCCASEALRLLTGQGTCPGMAPDRSPVWPEGTLGSISHSGDVAVAIAAHTGSCLGIGIDIERIMDGQAASEIAPEALTPWECRHLANDPFSITLAFSAKESLFKALHPLLRRPMSFRASELIAWDGRGTARLHLVEQLSPEFLAGREIEARFARLGDLLLTRVLVPA
ncbi:Enterobactin synthetase component D [Bosea sp. 62]|uniref:4'-phosphopantetheinyl transferase family protein n=1 Tax=unclassified Bosea (in: a-proteobacteria) TaxID=2653178 RepID=UPI00125106A0|nr:MULTISPECIES: 4'-phosphopantetheinyl transferase superfamily protein [unclassified Bosea (in: a-proteobacteria)]CAD5296193.1 Enterobactin synthetase component D [Bosea sp. 21B]CAD5296579.1 Enterobactin synthetase component D [Bosea sp. 46]CAD5297517.1 Enterobactin synthetase component D [Bosea sp. 7B]VVT61108.1 Enterobactin synthetase component D [Bosea sp. EC-HK365B]VXB15038.1 Enterobactin synthetase component D [Bosea sp. 125]